MNKKLKDSKMLKQKQPLHHACQEDHENIVSLSIKNNVDINKEDEFRLTPLHSACILGHENIVSLLLFKNNADINKKDQIGNPPDVKNQKKLSMEIETPRNSNSLDIRDIPFELQTHEQVMSFMTF